MLHSVSLSPVPSLLILEYLTVLLSGTNVQILKFLMYLPLEFICLKMKFIIWRFSFFASPFSQLLFFSMEKENNIKHMGHKHYRFSSFSSIRQPVRRCRDANLCETLMGVFGLEVQPSDHVKGVKGISKAKFKTKRASHLSSSFQFPWENSWRVSILTQTTISRKNSFWTCSFTYQVALLPLVRPEISLWQGNLSQGLCSPAPLHCQILQAVPTTCPSRRRSITAPPAL